MPQFKTSAREVRYVTVTVEAKDIDEAKRKFKSGDWDEIDPDMDAETEKVDCDLDSIEEA